MSKIIRAISFVDKNFSIFVLFRSLNIALLLFLILGYLLYD